MANSADPDILMKPTNLDLHYLQRQGISGFNRTGVKKEYLLIILGYFLFLHLNISCGYSLEVPHWDASNEYQQHTFLQRTGENYPKIIIKYSALKSLGQL